MPSLPQPGSNTGGLTLITTAALLNSLHPVLIPLLHALLWKASSATGITP